VDASLLENLFAMALQRTRTQALAFCWLPRSMHLAVRSHDTAVSRFMQRFTSQIAREFLRGTPDVGHVFPRRFTSMLIDAQAWLPELVRFIHHVPVRASAVVSPSRYPHSSWAFYAGDRSVAWFDTRSVRRILDAREESRSVIEFLECPPSAHELALFASTGRGESRIIGSDAFRASLPRRLHPPHGTLTLETLIAKVSITQNVSRSELLSRSRRREAVLARALIAWHAIERRLATLGEISRRLGRDPSTLSKTIARARRTHPQWFRLDSLRHLTPLGPPERG
jgi:hypothetical protein